MGPVSRRFFTGLPAPDGGVSGNMDYLLHKGSLFILSAEPQQFGLSDVPPPAAPTARPSPNINTLPPFPFHFCHRQSPSPSKYTWLNIAPPMIIKPGNLRACKHMGTGALQTSASANCFLESRPVWKHRDQRGHTVLIQHSALKLQESERRQREAGGEGSSLQSFDRQAPHLTGPRCSRSAEAPSSEAGSSFMETLSHSGLSESPHEDPSSTALQHLTR
ncbi:unnamed protein product [Pleuronectes platessa]|uniref:Uncharacterized protein n=1 Tax=Pleuronectes platessa TaxID=8262 RepID=A0A9N7YYT3_PLEPL|nr:unnamed protein product [Pleuronectes platessa]